MSGNPLFEKYGETIESGHVIFREGDNGEHMYIIQDGIVRITKEISGKQHLLAELSKGDFFGEMAIVSRIKRTATATAFGTVQLLSFDRVGFQGMIEKNAKIAMNVIDKLCRRLQQTNNQIHGLVRNNVKSVIALGLYYKIMEKPKDEQTLSLDTVVKDIAKSLDVSQAVVTEAVNSLSESGIVTISGNALKLKDRGKISVLVESMGG
jgi:CRP/FNR family transcriptional regulator, cyclic AMP receptor protein